MKQLILPFLLLITSLSYSQSKKKFIKEGNKLYNDSSYNMAEMKYRKSLEKDQEYFNASFNLADAVYKQERYDESTSFFESLKDNARNEKELAYINHNLGNSLLKENKIDLSIEAFKNSLRLNPDDEDTRYNLAYAQKMKQQQDQKDQQKDQEDQKDQQQDQKDQKDQQQDQKEKKDQQQDQKDQQTDQKKDEMSKEDAEKMLEALQQKEKELQEKLQKKKVKGQKIKILKDW